ncbi:hypothetical protein [Haliscomenobacter sp.]|uniref:hypothetical protein n=1 Tax=Haliscomenobacter sp. TaxID=2717303 RepID=UPI003BAC315E
MYLEKDFRRRFISQNEIFSDAVKFAIYTFFLLATHLFLEPPIHEGLILLLILMIIISKMKSYAIIFKISLLLLVGNIPFILDHIEKLLNFHPTENTDYYFYTNDFFTEWSFLRKFLILSLACLMLMIFLELRFVAIFFFGFTSFLISSLVDFFEIEFWAFELISFAILFFLSLALDYLLDIDYAYWGYFELGLFSYFLVVQNEVFYRDSNQSIISILFPLVVGILLNRRILFLFGIIGLIVTLLRLFFQHEGILLIVPLAILLIPSKFSKISYIFSWVKLQSLKVLPKIINLIHFNRVES